MKELLTRLDSHEFGEWMAYDMIEPFGEPAADMRNALLCSLLANIWRGKSQRAFKLSDFMLLKESPKRKRKTWQQLKNALIRKSKG